MVVAFSKLKAARCLTISLRRKVVITVMDLKKKKLKGVKRALAINSQPFASPEYLTADDYFDTGYCLAH